MSSRRRNPWLFWSMISVVLALVLIVPAFLFIPAHLYLLWIGSWSLATLVLYGVDKLTARGGGSRVPELVLLGDSLVGGFLGALVGMWFFRHKTRKPVFYVTNLLAAGLHIAGAVYIFLLH